MSTVDHVKDVNSGLVGPMIVCREGTLDDNGQLNNIKTSSNLFYVCTFFFLVDIFNDWDFLGFRSQKRCQK